MMFVAHPITGRIHHVTRNVGQLLIRQNGFVPVDERPDSTNHIMRTNRAAGL